MKIYVASAFSKDNQGGNKAGVCLLGDNLTARQKGQIALEMGYSETAFVSSPTSNLTDFQLEYFTPTEEVPLCGHATIATFIVMRELDLLKKEQFKIQTKSGILSITLKDDMIFMQQNKPLFFEKLISDAFNQSFDRKVTSEKLPIQIVSTGLRDIILPVANLDTLNEMKPNFGEIIKLSKEYDAVGIHAFTIENDRIISRNFAPLYDIPEESATGTASCALACYLYENHILKQSEYRFEQGYSLNQPSEIIVNLETKEDQITQVQVGGKGYLLESREVEV